MAVSKQPRPSLPLRPLDDMRMYLEEIKTSNYVSSPLGLPRIPGPQRHWDDGIGLFSGGIQNDASSQQ